MSRYEDDHEDRAGAPAEDARVDAVLRRHLRAPVGLGARLAAAVHASEPGGAASPTPAGTARTRAAGTAVATPWRVVPSLLMAAAALLLIVLLPRPRDASSSAASPAVEVAVAGDASIVGPCPADAGLPAVPDLASLYHEVVASTDARVVDGAEGCGGGPSGDSLLVTLHERYGAALREGADARRLSGPFPFEEWRGGTVLAGYPVAGGPASVLVAERADQLNCCIALLEPRDPDLRVFTWPMGDVVWIEITPAAEPSLLGLFELL